MSQAKAQTGAPPVSLFPFLAVLLCTMGALIVILVAIAHQARRHALRAARARQAEVQARLQQQVRELQARLQTLQEQLEQAREELQHDQQRLEQLAERKDRLEHEVRRWQTLLASQGEELDAEELDRLRDRLVWYRHKLQEIQAQLKQKPQPQSAVSYAIVPFQGRHGTRRRPIYIECRQDSVLLQPGGIELRARDFLHAGPENPLLAALRTTVRHWRRQGLPPEETPYPLILVRPQGIAAYYAVRRALQNWKGPLGYELIEEDWQLEFGPEDPQLVQLQRLAVQKARRLQRQLARGSSGSRSSTQQGLYQADTFGGLRPVGPAGTVSGHGSSSASGSTGSGTGTGQGFGAQAFVPTRSTTAAARSQRTGGGDPALAAADSRRATSGLGGGSSGPVFPGGSLRSGGGRLGAGPRAGEPLSGTTPSGADSAPGLQSTLAQDAGNRGGNSLFDRGQPGTGAGNAASGPAPSEVNTPARQFFAGEANAGSNAGAGSLGAAGGVARGQASGRGAAGLGLASAGGGSSAVGLSSSSSGAVAGGSPAAAGTAADSSAQQQGGPLGFSALLNQGDPARSAPQANRPHRHDHSGAAALMEDPPPGAIPLRRAIRINLYPDRLVVLHNGSLRATAIPLDQPLGRWATQLTDVLAREIQSWGKAGRGMYWKPALRVHVAPGAQEKWQLLRQALRTSGLELQPVR